MSTAPQAAHRPRRHRSSAAPSGGKPPSDMRNAAQALVLQGGGALGAYQAGVFDALSVRGRQPQWVAGVSIGAINAALIAGNAPEHRVERLRAFWELVSSAPSQQIPAWAGDRAMLNQWSANAAAMFGIPGFFRPLLSPELALGGAARLLGCYDTAPLKSTLERLVDFDRINAREMRLSVGAVDLRKGNSVYFDNTLHRIGPEHIMASGALPPGFPPVEVDGAWYWDGGLVSNTPLQYVLDQHPRSAPLVVCQVDLFSASGPMPVTMSDVAARQKDIVYSSRTRLNTDVLAANMNLQQAIADLIAKLPPALRDDASVRAVQAELTHQPIDVYHLIYRHRPYERDSKDYEFSRASVDEHWAAGVRDMQATLSHPQALRSEAQSNGVTTFDLADCDAVKIRHPMAATGGRLA